MAKVVRSALAWIGSLLVLGGCATWTVADQQLSDALGDSDAAQVRAALTGGARADVVYSNGMRPLSLAVLGNNKATVQALLKAGADPNFIHPAKSLEGVVRARVLDVALKAGSHDPEVTEGLNLLALAADADMMRLLVDGGADPNFRDQFGATALLHAARDGNVGLVTALTEVGADPNLADMGGRTALATALAQGRTAVIEALLAGGADPNRTDWRGRNALHQAAMIPSGYAIPLLLRPGLDLNARDSDGCTALILAARDGYSGSVRALLAAGADSSLRDAAGYTALEWATAKRHADVIALLSAGGTDAPPEADAIETIRSRKVGLPATDALVVLTSSVTTDGRNLRVRGRITNPHAEPIRGVRYRVVLHQRGSNRVLDAFFDKRDDTEIPAEGSAALRLDIASMYAATGGYFTVDAIPMRVGDREIPEPPEWRGRD